MPETMPNGIPWPTISIVTPSFNQGAFIEETICSILLQSYPNFEYIIIDGGSTDNSVEIIRKYEPWLTYWVSEPDYGQSHALNKGFRRTTGEIMAYLNSDDIYYPNVLRSVASHFQESGADILIGSLNRVYIDQGRIESEEILSPQRGNRVHRFPVFTNGRDEDFRCLQPSMFWTRAIWERTGEFDERLHYMMDREWCLRALAKGARVSTTEEIFTRFLVHPGSKGNDEHLNFIVEMVPIYRRLSRLPEFRRVPCVLASFTYYLSFLKESFYTLSMKFYEENRKISGWFVLWMARILRCAVLVMKNVAVKLRGG